MQVAAAAREYWPAAHCAAVGEVLPTAQAYPAVQLPEHAAEGKPVAAPYVPPGHRVHATAPPRLNCPAAHASVHVALVSRAVDPYRPAAHCHLGKIIKGPGDGRRKRTHRHRVRGQGHHHRVSRHTLCTPTTFPHAYRGTRRSVGETVLPGTTRDSSRAGGACWAGVPRLARPRTGAGRHASTAVGPSTIPYCPEGH